MSFSGRSPSVVVMMLVGASALFADANQEFQRGSELMKQGRYQDAEQAFQSALQDARRRGDLAMEFLADERLAFVAKQEGNTPNQEQYLLAGLRVRQGMPQATAPLPAYLDLEQFYVRQKDWQKQAGVLQQIIAIWSQAIDKGAVGLAQYEYKLGSALTRLNDYSGAEAQYLAAIDHLKKDPKIYSAATGRVRLAYALLLDRENKTDEAEKQFALLMDDLRDLNAADYLVIDAKRSYQRLLRRIGKVAEGEALGPIPERGDKSGRESLPQQLIRQDPPYSDEARRNRVMGSILLTLVVDESGNPQNVHVLEPLGCGLDEKAVKAVQSWKFRPAMKDGAPIVHVATAEVNFRLL